MNIKLSTFNQKQITWSAITAITLSYFTLRLIREYKHNKMIKICKNKRNARDQDIQNYIQLKLHCSLSEEIKTKIIRSSITQIKQMLYDGQFTVKQLLLLYIERTLNIGLKLNLITDINFIKSLQEAEELDQLIQQDKNIIYQYDLFGIPISIKDTIQQQGFDTTFGLASRCFKPEPYDSLQIAHLKQAKALLFVRSNIPQCVMMFETDNNIFGQAKNPWNHSRTVGGSSGGEAGLVVSGCSVIGLGADMGGSIRIPSAFCGAYGFVPTVGRVSSLGEGLLKGPSEGIMNVKCSKGPIGKCVDDLIIFTKVLLSKEYYSKVLREQPKLQDFYWNPTELGELPNKKLKIGIIHQFDQLIPPNCMIRGVKEAAQALQQQGHEVVDFQFDQKLIFKYSWIFLNLITAEGGFRKFYDILEGEKPIEIYSLLERSCATANWIRKYILSFILRLAGQTTIYNINKNTIPTDVYGYQVRSGIQRELTLEFLNLMKSQNIDALILPGFGLPAIKHYSAKHLPMVGLYTWIWNTMNVPIGSMPITVVQNEQDKTIIGKENSIDVVYREINRNLKDSDGLPVNIQVLSYPYQDEVVLKVMKDIEQEIKFNVKYAYPL